MIIWVASRKVQEQFSATILGDGGIYDPETKSWVTIPNQNLDPNAPSARAFHTAIWTGETGRQDTSNKMLIYGGVCKR